MVVALSGNVVFAGSINAVAVGYVSEHYSLQPVTRKITFLSGSTRVSGNYAVVSSPAIFSDGSTTDDFVEDLVFVLGLRKTSTWEIVFDLSGADVPAGDELKFIKKTFPQDFPRELLPVFWQEMIKGK